MRVADGIYHLFHHHSLYLKIDEFGEIISVMHINTNTQHVTNRNNKVVLLTGIGSRNDYCQLNLNEDIKNHSISTLSKREMAVLKLLSQGLGSEQIALILFISSKTVKVHRKNLLKKLKVTNTSNLIKRGIELGYI